MRERKGGSAASSEKRLGARSADEASQFARAAAAAAIAASVAIFGIELARIALYADHVVVAVLATAIAMPLHLRHVVYGLRGEQPPAGGVTLTAQGIVTLATAFLIGSYWLMNLAPLAVSSLIVLRRPWALPAYIAIVLSTGPLSLLTPLGGTPAAFDWATYFTLSALWRSVTLFVFVWLVAALRKVDITRRELRERAVVGERMRIDTDLRSGLGIALEEIVSGGVRALQAVHSDQPTAMMYVQTMVDDSRRALAKARTLVAGYQRMSVRDELKSGMSLLGAAGIEADLVESSEDVLELADAQSLIAVRLAIAGALRNDSLSQCVITVVKVDAGAHVLISSKPRSA